MAVPNEVLVSLGLDQEKLDAMLAQFGQKFKASLTATLKDFDVGKAFTIDLTDQKRALNAYTQERIDKDAEVAAKNRQWGIDNFNAQKREAAELAQLQIDENSRIAAAKRASDIAGFKSQLAASQATGGSITPENNVAIPSTFDALKSRLQSNITALFNLREALAQAGLSLADVEKKTKSFEDANTRTSVKIDQLGVKLQEEGADFVKLNSQMGKINETLDTHERLLGKVNVANVANTSKVIASDNIFKNWAFSIGLVGYGMENLGRRLVGFSETLFRFLKSSSETTESLERLRNALIVRGVPADERNSIEAQIRRIADMPTGKLDTVTKAFKEFTAAGLSSGDALMVLEGIMKGAAIEGKQGGAEKAIDVIQRALISKENPFVGRRGIGGLEADVGSSVQAAAERVAGSLDPKALNLAGGPAFVIALGQELNKLPAPLAVTADRINRIENAITNILSQLERFLGPSLDKTLVVMHDLEGIITRIANKFDTLSDPTKNFISTLIAAIPVILAGLGAILSVAGVLAVGLAVYGKLAKVLVDVKIGLGAAATESGVLIKQVSLMTVATTKLSELGFGGLLSGLGKILGLTGPIGITINLLLAYATNAGKARDNINAAFSELFESIGKLSAQLSGPAGSAILKFFETITNVTGGILGSVFATLIIEINNLVKGLTELLDLLDHPSVENFKKLVDTLSKATYGWAIDLGKLIAASMIDSMNELVPKQDTFGKKILADVITPISALASIGWIDGGTAQRLRDSVFNKPIEAEVNASGLKKSTEEAKKLNIELLKIKEIFHGMDGDFAKLTTQIADLNAKFTREQIIAATKEAQKSSMDKLDLLAGQDPQSALNQLPALIKAQEAASIKNLRDAAGVQVKILSENVDSARQILEAAFEDSMGLKGSPEAIDLKIKYLNTLRALVEFSASGKVDWNQWSKLIDQAKLAHDNLDKLMASLNAGNQAAVKPLGDISKATGDITNKIGEVTKALFDNREAIKKVQGESEKELKTKTESLEKDIKKIAILKELRPLLEEEATLAAERKDKAASLVDPFLSEENRSILNARIKEIDDRFETIKAKVLVLKKDFSKDELKVIAELEAANTESVDKITKSAEASKTATENRINAVTQLMNAFKAGFTTLDTFRQKLQAIDDVRIKLGLLPREGGREISEDLRSRLTANIAGLISSNDQLGVGGVSGIPSALVTGQRLTSITHLMSLGQGLPSVDELSKIAETSILLLRDADEQINKNRLRIEQAKTLLDLAKPGPEADKARQDYNDLLDTQTKITKQAIIEENILSGITQILDTNVALVEQDFKGAKEINASEIVRLELMQKRIDLQLQLENQLVSNREKQSGLAGGLVSILDWQNTDKLAADALKSQIALLQNKYDIQVKTLEQQQLSNNELEKSGKISASENQKRQDDLQAQLDILKKINAEDIKGANFDSAAKSASNYRNILMNLGAIFTENIFKNFTKNLQLAANSQHVAFNSMKASASLLKDVVAAAVVAGFDTISHTLIGFLEGADNLLKGMGAFFGSILMSIGEMLIQLSVAAVATAFMTEFFKEAPIWGAWIALGMAAAAAAAVAPFAAIGIAVGGGLVLAGRAMGGTGSQSPSASTVNANATNGANSAAGATGNNFDPSKDQKTMFQKAQMLSVLIDVRADDGLIVKKVIKAVNSNGRLATLVGNRQLGFGY